MFGIVAKRRFGIFTCYQTIVHLIHKTPKKGIQSTLDIMYTFGAGPAVRYNEVYVISRVNFEEFLIAGAKNAVR